MSVSNTPMPTVPFGNLGMSWSRHVEVKDARVAASSTGLPAYSMPMPHAAPFSAPSQGFRSSSMTEPIPNYPPLVGALIVGIEKRIGGHALPQISKLERREMKLRARMTRLESKMRKKALKHVV
ncbi:hypothetical protein CALVIDRAFT_541761 [Calocera viscosa TUFC12733]|uniref:Uncharacterized protein n=1 Tax=Calocera viscosa (strain TUFC12733) TaxID=1330018 RepID=A0A167HC79_CALVF|nr:hypothetical protein CALVIDRAFT_541761 [Calocera viscosa TUFC12733]